MGCSFMKAVSKQELGGRKLFMMAVVLMSAVKASGGRSSMNPNDPILVEASKLQELQKRGLAMKL